MSIKIFRTELPDVLLIHPEVFVDQRGFFQETYHERRYEESSLTFSFVQDNLSHSIGNTLRGLHYQLSHPQGKLIYVVQGEIFDAAIDIRRNSPTFRKWVGVRLSAENHQQIYVPPGFAHGFCVLSETADVIYKCTDFYYAEDDHGILWSDPDIAIDWPVRDPLLSAKDSKLPLLSDLAEHLLPRMP